MCGRVDQAEEANSGLTRRAKLADERSRSTMRPTMRCKNGC